MRHLAFIPLIALLGCADSMTTQPSVAGDRASAAMLLNEKDEVVDFAVTACNGEPLLLNGTVHLKFSMTGPHSNGGFTNSFSSDYKLSGVGPVTGAKYNATQKLSDKAIVNENATISASDVSLRVIGQGKVPDSVLRFRVRVVMANGEIRSEHVDISSNCF